VIKSSRRSHCVGIGRHPGHRQDLIGRARDPVADSSGGPHENIGPVSREKRKRVNSQLPRGPTPKVECFGSWALAIARLRLSPSLAASFGEVSP
jgi:hypothetical protein